MVEPEGISKEAQDVIEAWCTNPMGLDLARQVQDTQVFLRMAVIELRRLAERTPDIATELRHLGQKLEEEAEDLARCNNK